MENTINQVTQISRLPRRYLLLYLVAGVAAHGIFLHDPLIIYIGPTFALSFLLIGIYSAILAPLTTTAFERARRPLHIFTGLGWSTTKPRSKSFLTGNSAQLTRLLVYDDGLEFRIGFETICIKFDAIKEIQRQKGILRAAISVELRPPSKPWMIGIEVTDAESVATMLRDKCGKDGLPAINPDENTKASP